MRRMVSRSSTTDAVAGVLTLAGFAGLVYGVALLNGPAAWIVAGLLTLTAAGKIGRAA
jgi:hypothetical protein